MKSLLKSRKFWLAVLNMAVSTATYFVTKYAAPEIGNDILWVIGTWQPGIVMLIAGIAIEDAAKHKANNLELSDEDAAAVTEYHD